MHRKPRIGIVAPLIAEAVSYAHHRLPPGGPYEIGGQLLYIAGSGASRAEAACEVLLRSGVGGLVSWGSAGALRPELAFGCLLVPARVYGRKTFLCSESWRRAICERVGTAVRISAEPILHVDEVLTSQAVKRERHLGTGAAAADMESGVIAEFADKHEVPFIAIRAISDADSTVIPEIALDSVDDYGRVSLSNLTVGLLRRPFSAVELLRLARGFRSACITLRSVVDHLGPHLAFPE